MLILTFAYSANTCWQNDTSLAFQTSRHVNQKGKRSQIPPSSSTFIKLRCSLSPCRKEMCALPLFFFLFYCFFFQFFVSIFYFFKKEVHIYQKGIEVCAPFLIQESKPADISSWLNLVPSSPFLATPRSDPADFCPAADVINDWLVSQSFELCRDGR